MDQGHGSSETDISPILELPREVRDLIFDHVLVKERISIECAVTKSPHRSQNQHRRNPPVNPGVMYPLKRSWAHRRVWTVPTFDIGETNMSNFDRDVLDAHMSYQIGADVGDANLALLRVCKQIYAEASKIFYSRNMFSFTTDFRVPTAFAFLCDRPAASLLQIRSIELALMEANNMRGTGGAHYPVINRSTDSFVLQFTYQYFTELCTLLSTSRMRLRKLHLIVETLSHSPEESYNTFRNCIAYEKRRSKSPRPWTPLWLDPLLKVEGLESLQMRWVAHRPQLLRMQDTMIAIQAHMLKGPASTILHAVHTQTECDNLSVLRFQFLQQDRDNLLEGYPNLDDLKRDVDGCVCACEDNAELNGDVARFKTAPQCLEILQEYNIAYASFFELGSA